MKTTKEQFKAFKAECEKWIKCFGLLGWRFYYQHADIEGNQLAYCCFPDEPEDRVFTLGFTVNLGATYCDTDLKRSAFHEVMEALLYRIRYLAHVRYIQPEEINEEIHNLIRILENVVYKEV